ncbi:hypothetical protein [Nonomuraea jabiensis]|uniref:Uncharacterized protein n=1 Tax=Nonomuraea jabiensis TaxID=882448 RepID=A0A7W9LH47_9ACTN|nr:hypothetical protein [Nonomuraea jabiensis]MBB5783614.1 hypothetical protein [Nonomuraea jabiensis]
MDALDWLVPLPKKAVLGRSHVDLTRCRIQGAPAAATALTALRTALTPAPAGSVVVEVRIDAGAELPPEGYTLTAGETGVVIVGADPGGSLLAAEGTSAAVEQALARAEAHEANVLRGVIPPFVRAVLERTA